MKILSFYSHLGRPKFFNEFYSVKQNLLIEIRHNKCMDEFSELHVKSEFNKSFEMLEKIEHETVTSE